MPKDDTKDRRINIRLDEDTYFAIKKVVERDLKTDISSYCRSLLWISTLHDATIRRIKHMTQQYRDSWARGITRNGDMENFEHMVAIKDEIQFIEKFIQTMKDNRQKYDEFISLLEKRHEMIKAETREYFKIYNEAIDLWEKESREHYGDEYDTNPTIGKPGGKIII